MSLATPRNTSHDNKPGLLSFRGVPVIVVVLFTAALIGGAFT